MTTEATPAPGAPEATPTPAPAPVPGAPAAPPTPAPAPSEQGPAPVQYEATGNAGLDLALGFLGDLGFGPDDAALVAAANGDWTQLEAALGKLGDKAKGWERILAVGKAAYSDLDKANKEKAEAESAKIAQVTDGQWDKIQEWAKTNATEDERAQVNAALKAGGIAAVAVAKYLGELYSRTTEYTKPAAPAVQQNAARTAPVDSALSPTQYAQEVRALAAKGGVYSGSPAYAALQARRAAYRG